MNHIALSVLAAPLFALAPAAQQTIIVQGGGNAFRSAVQAAQPGDILVVRSGSYFGGTVQKGITVRCDASVVFVQDGRSTALSVFPPSGQLFRMRGGHIANFGALFPSLAAGGEGTSVFEGTTIAHAATISSRQISFHDCAFGETLIRDGARAAISECRTSGTLRIVDSDVTIGQGIFLGTGSTPFIFKPAIEATNSHITIAESTSLTAGGGAFSTAPAIQADGGRIVLGPNVQLFSNSSPITGSATVITRHLPAIEAAPAGAGQTFAVTVRGEVGSSTHVLASLPTAPWATPFGTLWVSTDLLQLDSGIIPASGARTTNIPLPANLPADLPLVLQSITTLTNGQLWVGPPTVVLLD